MMNTQKELQIRILSSLAKVFPQRIYGRVSRSCEAVCGQEVSFQIAYRLAPAKYAQKDFCVKIESPLQDHVTAYTVGVVPSVLSVYPDNLDENYLTTQPGMFPDPLFPLENDSVSAAVHYWRSLWISVRIPEDCRAGKYPVRVSFFNEANGESVKAVFQIRVADACLPEQKLIFTQWFHCDCIADAHGVEIFSEEHWNLIERYMRLAAQHGMNMILTPIVTPPLDTAVGAERPTVQLVEVEKEGDSYRFDFSRLGRFLRMAQACGIRHFEISHLFTQWGVAHAPKVVARENGEERRIFGWDTDATCDAYKCFLQALIPNLLTYMKEAGIEEHQIWFHVSDEPRPEHLEAYRAAKEILQPLIGGCHHMDALSDFAFYQQGLLPTPVVATKHIEPYLEANVPGLWCYYCCSGGVKVSNRFFSMPSARNRIIGVQMYKYGIEGFLHWGYNFYYTRHSKRKVNPYAETDAGAAFPSGDAFSVYPYRDGAIPSLRQKVFANALEDIRLLELLEQKLGRARVIEELERIAGMEITFSQYPKDEGFFDELYRFILQNV